MQPWEYGSLPRDWINPIVREVDEVWAYTRYVRDCYVESGVPAERVHVVPLGVDTQRFHPQAVPLALATKKPFKFLFVGGTIVRKGIDVLLKAYRREFSANDPVCLVIKDMGGGSFYRGQTAQAAIAEHQADLLAPEIEYIDRNLTADELVGLYAACQSLVHPYRGEGFGLPIAEAMACELPVIVTGAGAAMDYCNQDNAFLIPARKTYLPAKRIGSLQTVSQPWLLEPDEEALQAHLRNVFEHPEEAKAKGRAAGAHIRQHFGWENVLNAVEHRLSELQRQPVRRTRLKNSVMPVIRPASRGEPAPTGQRVSLCMIVKNEAANLPACLHSAADLVDELIVVDTGSTDITKELAKECGARVYDFKWVDDFAAARNESLRYATGDWIFWLDGDDRLDEENREKLRKLFASLRDENVAYAMKCRCLPERQTGTATLVDHIRLFRNSRDIRWRYRVHEQILPAVRGAGGSVRTTDIVIEHTGYIDGALRRKKQQRDMRLLELDRAEHPDDPFILFNLGWSYEELRRPLEALPLLRRSLKLSHPADSIVRKLYTLIMECHRQLGQRNEALAACQEGRGYYPDDAQLLFQEGILRRDLGDLPGAEACWVRLLSTTEGPHLASVVEGLRGHKTRHNLAVVYQKQGRSAEAETQWKAALDEEPGFVPAWLGLGDLYLSQGRLVDVNDLVERLKGTKLVNGQGVTATALLRARSLMAHAEFSKARRVLQEAIATAPNDLWLWVVLSHTLLQEGKEWDSAEKALRKVLELDPSNTEARNNLTILLRQQGAAACA